MELKIDSEFQSKVPPLTEEEFNQLEQNILYDKKVFQPIIVWDGIIIDGHNRWRIIQKHPEITYEIQSMDFSDRYEAIVWICKNQLGRRNLTDEQKSYLRGKQYEAEKKAIGASDGFRGNQHTNPVAGQNVRLPKSRKEIKDGTAGRIGKEYGVDGRTIRRDADFAKGVDFVDTIAPGAKEKILSGSTNISKGQVISISNLDEDTQKKVAVKIASGQNVEKSDFAEQQRIVETVAIEMYDSDLQSEYSLDDLLDEIRINTDKYISSLRRTFMIRSAMLNNEARTKSKALINEYIISEIKKVRDLL